MAMKKTTASPDMIEIQRADAVQLLELFRNVEAADAHYKRCQSDLFRQHVQATYKATLVEGAYSRLQELVDKAVEG